MQLNSLNNNFSAKNEKYEASIHNFESAFDKWMTWYMYSYSSSISNIE